jgi:hypothetical protein
MPTVLMRDVLWRASTMLQDTKPQFYRHLEHDMVDAANDAQTAIAKFLPSACSRVDSVRLVPGTKQSIQAIPAAYCKPGDGSTPAVPIIGTQVLDVVRNMGADGLTPGMAIRIIPGKVQDAQDRNWHTSAAVAVKAFVYDPATPRYFWVYPGAHASTQVWLDIAYTAQPLAIPNTGTEGAELYAYAGSSTQTITIADEHLDDIVNYIVARMLFKPSEWSDAQKGNAFAAMFTGSLNAKVQALTGHNPNIRHLPMASGAVGQPPP